jgi:hypothetical protein
MRHRWYDPVTARWLSRDPILGDGGQYSFVRGAPTEFADPLGLKTAIITVQARGLGWPHAAIAVYDLPNRPLVGLSHGGRVGFDQGRMDGSAALQEFVDAYAGHDGDVVDVFHLDLTPEQEGGLADWIAAWSRTGDTGYRELTNNCTTVVHDGLVAADVIDPSSWLGYGILMSGFPPRYVGLPFATPGALRAGLRTNYRGLVISTERFSAP